MAYSKIRKDGTAKLKPGRKPSPPKPKPEPYFVRGVERPHVWKIGPDQNLHRMYMPWLRAKAQAAFRQEPWDLTFDDWAALWHGLWDQRGRGIDEYCITRIIKSGPWSTANCHVVTRREHLSIQIQLRQGQPRKKYKPRKTNGRHV